MTPSRAAFEQCEWVHLHAWIESGQLEPALLTFAAETYGRRGGAAAVPLLARLLSHDERMVREGAVLGMEAALIEVVHGMRGMAERDESLGVRTAVSEALENVKEELP